MPMKNDYLSVPEQEFAEQHHGLLLKFMGEYHLNDDYYGALALRYLRTVQRYLSEAHLRKYAFSTVVWLNLRSELSHIFRAERKTPVFVPLEESGISQEPEHNYDGELDEISNALTLKQRQVFELWKEGYSYDEIAKHCNISYKAVESRFARIRGKAKLF